MRGGTNYIPPHSLARLLSYLNAARDIMGRGSLPAHKSAREYIYVCVCVCVCAEVRRESVDDMPDTYNACERGKT